MKNHYNDITSKLGEPKWWDEYGVPRYCKFSPRESADIYAREVALCEIRCQDCGRLFHVAMSRSAFSRGELLQAIRDHSLHYGDPPNFGCCPAGPTMNSEFVGVLEYWAIGKNHEFKRHRSVERKATK